MYLSELEAVIEIGSTGIRLMAFEITEKAKWNVIDKSEYPVPLGHDVFTTGYVSMDTILQMLHILNRFKEQLQGWAITENHTHLIATSALREAKNRDAVVDRVFVKTGFRTQVIDGIEENRLMFIALLEALKSEIPQFTKFNSLILEIGGGSTEIMLLDHGKMTGVHSLRLGTVLLEQRLKSVFGTSTEIYRFLEEFTINTGKNLKTEINLGDIKVFITIGAEARIAAMEKGEKIAPKVWSISKKNYNKFVDEVTKYSPEEIMARFSLSYNDAKAFNVGLLTYKLFLNLTQAEEIIVTDTNIREGLILSMFADPNAEIQQNFLYQVIASARNLGKKYQYDEQHAKNVCKMALQIFDIMKEEIGLDSHGRQLLEIASLLHDVGMFIRGSDHQLHSYYIILHSDIFGLTKDDMQIISLVAKYHRGVPPNQSDSSFSSLPRAERVTVLKLAAILRVADALDRSHSQQPVELSAKIIENSLVLRIHGVQSLNLEKIALNEKGVFFESVFGYKLVLESNSVTDF